MEARQAKRTIHFFELIIEGSGKPVPTPVKPADVFSAIEAMPFTDKGRYMPRSDGNSLMVRLLEKPSAAGAVVGVIGLRRLTGLPMEEVKGEAKPLELDPDASVYEPAHFVVFPLGAKWVVGMEYNHYGPRPAALVAYLKEKAANPVSNVTITLLVNNDVAVALKRFKEVNVLKIRVAGSGVDRMRDVDESLYAACREAKAISKGEAETKDIEIIVRCPRGQGMTVAWLSKLPAFLGRTEGREALLGMRVRATAKETDKVSDFDLLRDKLIATKRVVCVNDETRCVQPASMVKAIRESFDELKTDLARALGQRE